MIGQKLFEKKEIIFNPNNLLSGGFSLNLKVIISFDYLITGDYLSLKTYLFLCIGGSSSRFLRQGGSSSGFRERQREKKRIVLQPVVC